MTQSEKQLNNKFKENFRELRLNKNCNLTIEEEVVENSRPGPFISENKHLTLNTEINNNISQDIRFQSSEMDELKQPSTLFVPWLKLLELLTCFCRLPS